MSAKHTQTGKTDDKFLTLGDAAKVAPGRPSTNTVWRWCRKGVRSRTGQRIRLRHVRAGGKIFTQAPWIEAFVHELAAADAAHFAREASDAPCLAETSKVGSKHLNEHKRALANVVRRGLI